MFHRKKMDLLNYFIQKLFFYYFLIYRYFQKKKEKDYIRVGSNNNTRNNYHTRNIINKASNKIMKLTIDKYKVSLNISSKALNEISKLSRGRNELRAYGMLKSISHINN